MDMCDISGAAVPCGMFFAEHGILKLTVSGPRLWVESAWRGVNWGWKKSISEETDGEQEHGAVRSQRL